MDLTIKQRQIVEAKEDRIVVQAAAASGKALENGSIVYTDNGPVKIEDLNIGDKIYGADGNLCNIIGVYPQGKKKKYIVKFTDRTEINCCNEHLWTFQTESLRSNKSKTWITASLQEIIDNYDLFKSARAKNNFGSKSSYRKNIWIPMVQPINFPSHNVPLDPYTLGALLGDGHLQGRSHSSSFTNQDSDVINKVELGLKKINCSLTAPNSTRKYDYIIKQNVKIGAEVGKLNLILEQLNLNFTKSDTKFIPNIYKYNDINTRIAVLQGLIDTDGSCSGSAYDITLKSKQLILDIKEICESLGFTAVYSIKKAICTNAANGEKDCGEVYRLHIKTNKSIPKIHTSNRREQQWKQPKVYAHRAIEEIIETDEYVEMTCIQVDNKDSLFVTNNFIVTHNTKVLTERVRYLLKKGISPSSIAVITFTRLAAQELVSRLAEDYQEGIFIGTIHALAARFLSINGMGQYIGRIAEEEDFDKLFYLCNQLNLRDTYEYVIVDEAQDCGESELRFIFDLMQPSKYFFALDFNQSIYSFRGARPDLVKKYLEDATYYTLNQNFRNSYNILYAAQDILKKRGMKDNSVPMRSVAGVVEKSKYNRNELIEWINTKDTYKDWAILCRQNKDKIQVIEDLKEAGIPVITFKQGEINRAQLNDLMDKDVVKVLTVHSAKGLEWNNVVLLKLWWSNKDPEEARINYVAMTRARDLVIKYS